MVGFQPTDISPTRCLCKVRRELRLPQVLRSKAYMEIPEAAPVLNVRSQADLLVASVVVLGTVFR